MTQSARYQMRLGDAIESWLIDRSERCGDLSPAMQLRAELELHHELLRLELARILLTVAEASCLADVAAGSLMSRMPAALRYEAEDAFRLARSMDPTGGDVSSYAAKWGVDETAILAKLASASPSSVHALADALSRWWATDGEATVEGFGAVGISIIRD